MSNHSRTTEGLARENGRVRRERNAALQALRTNEQVLREYQRDAIEGRISGRLLMIDFDSFIGVDEVVDPDGRLDPWRLEQLVSALLGQRPGLAVVAATESEAAT